MGRYTSDYAFWIGAACTCNFLVFWALPIAGMGQIWKLALQYPLHPVFNAIDKFRPLRAFAENYVYSKPKYADYFAISLLVLVNSIISLSIMFYYQLVMGGLPWWLIACYNCAWVGLGGRAMGAAYTLAHKEGHNKMMYKKSLRAVVGNFFEDVLGVFYGSVPTNFATSHVHIHHKLNGGMGDTFYQWDLDRSSWADLMIFQQRILMHMTGISSLRYFLSEGKTRMADRLKMGMVKYWIIYPALLFVITWSPSFIFWVYFEPLLCMTYFLAFINTGFHAFVEFDSAGNHIDCVNASCIIEGDDDYYGEDDHMAHHHATSVYHRDLTDHQQKQVERWKNYKASVFRGLSIVELSLFILLKDWDRLADHYVDYSDKPMSRNEIKQMLARRASTIEITTEEYREELRRRDFARASGDKKYVMRSSRLTKPDIILTKKLQAVSRIAENHSTRLNSAGRLMWRLN